MNEKPEFRPSLVEIEGMDWENDDLFYTHTWSDETSEFDTHHSVRWEGNYYSVIHKVRIPIVFKNCEELREKFINLIIDDYPDVKGFWTD